jgi:neurotransmitter:Na+ symporter, NSS family
LLDVLVALMTSLFVFAFVFATPGIEASQGPGLIFVTLPVAFGAMPAGLWVGSAFFLMVILAAWVSTISLLEPAVAYLNERFDFHRISACLLVSGSAWLLGLGSVLSFNEWSEQDLIWGMNFRTSLDFFSANLLLPFGGLLMAIFVGWVINNDITQHELQQDSPRLYLAWRFVLRYLAPLAVLVIIINGLYPVFTFVTAE